MKFEHLIQINDPANPLILPLTRKQLWNGLVLRAEFPKLFLPNLDDCTITSRETDCMTRTLRFGDFQMQDRVYFHFLNFVHYEVQPQGEIPNSSLRMSIEEPEPAKLFVRFHYTNGQTAEEDKANALYDDFRRKAYIEADIDTIKILREMHCMGRLDNLLT